MEAWWQVRKQLTVADLVKALGAFDQNAIVALEGHDTGLQAAASVEQDGSIVLIRAGDEL